MTELQHLMMAVRDRLSPEELRLLRFAYRPLEEAAYDRVFDGVAARLEKLVEPSPPPDPAPEREP